MATSAAADEALSSSTTRLIRFGVFELNIRTGELRKRGRRVRIADQPVRVLQALLERPGDLVTREELRRQLWSSDTFVAFDPSLNSAVRKLREALGDSADDPKFIETLPRRGYRFIAEVERVPPPLAPPIVADRNGDGRSPRVGQRRTVVPIAAGGVLLTLVLAGTWLGLSTRPPASIRSVAVLPLVNWTGDPGRDYVVDGLTDALILTNRQPR